MKGIIIAASSKPPNAEEEIRSGKRYRLDYIELAESLGFPYEDYQGRGLLPRFLQPLEGRLRLDFSWSWQLSRQIKKEKYDVVFSLSERVSIPLCFFLNRRLRHYVTMHHPMSPRKLRLIKALRMPDRWDRILVFSKAEAEAMTQALGLPEGIVKVIHFAIDTGFYDPSEVEGIPEAENFIFSIGLSHRDYPTLLQALLKLPQIDCRMSGTSAWVKHKAGYENEVLPDNVQICHYDHPNIIREIYAKSRFVVIPIRHDTTQWSAGAASVLQPQAMGKPVIATQTPGLSDYVLDGETGILVEGENPQAMASAIEYLWNNPEIAAKMGRRGYEWVREEFSLERWIDKVDILVNSSETLDSTSDDPS